MKTKGIGKPPKETALKQTPLGDVLVDIQAGKCLSCEERPASLEEWGVLKVSALTWGEFRPWENKVLPAGFEVPTDLEVRSGDLLISRSNTTELVGAIALVGETRSRLMLSDKTLRLVPRRDVVSPEYLEYALRTPACRDFIEQNATGASSSMKNITQSTIRSIPLLLPPLAEQRRIAARLKEELAEVVRARAAVEAQLKAAQLLPAALLRDVFQDSDAKMWPIKPFGEVVDNFDGQRVPLNLTDRQKRQGDYAYYGASGIIDHIDDYRFDGEFLLIGEDGANLLARSTPIAFSAAGKFWVNNNAHVVRPKQGVLLDWLRHYFASIDLSPFVSGSAQPKLSQESLNTIPTPVPSKAVQSELVRKLNSELGQHETLSNSIQSRLDTIEKLPASLLRNAFPTVS